MNINIFVPDQNAFAQCEDVKSFVDDLSLGQGVVLSRVASTLRKCVLIRHENVDIHFQEAVSMWHSHRVKKLNSLIDTSKRKDAENIVACLDGIPI